MDQLDQQVGGDPYLNLFRANIAMGQNDAEAARGFVETLIKALPDKATEGYGILLDQAIETQNHVETTRVLKALEAETPVRFPIDFNKAEPFANYRWRPPNTRNGRPTKMRLNSQNERISNASIAQLALHLLCLRYCEDHEPHTKVGAWLSAGAVKYPGCGITFPNSTAPVTEQPLIQIPDNLGPDEAAEATALAPTLPGLRPRQTPSQILRQPSRPTWRHR